jgi:hypothetical protein
MITSRKMVAEGGTGVDKAAKETLRQVGRVERPSVNFKHTQGGLCGNHRNMTSPKGSNLQEQPAFGSRPNWYSTIERFKSRTCVLRARDVRSHWTGR